MSTQTPMLAQHTHVHVPTCMVLHTHTEVCKTETQWTQFYTGCCKFLKRDERWRTEKDRQNMFQFWARSRVVGGLGLAVHVCRLRYKGIRRTAKFKAFLGCSLEGAQG